MAYILYTSGTTGNPKGVLIGHDNLYVLLHDLDEKFGYSTAVNFAATTNITFDISTVELLGSLCHGKKIVLFKDEEILGNTERFIEKLRKNKVEILQLTPTRLSLIRDAVFEGKIESLTHLILGGEPIPHNIFEQIINNKKLKVINGYGPTETTIYSLAKSLDDSHPLTIGTPMNNETIYIVGPNNSLQPFGVEGEICISGAGVGRGYLNHPEHTAERFIENPFSGTGRLYRTGDIGRFLPNKEIEYIRRNDDQVKINGIRIELKEIEHHLRNHKDINEAVVLVKEFQLEKSLIGYIVSDKSLSVDLLRDFLKEYLPYHLIPGNYVQVNSIPFGTSGKVNKRELLTIETTEMTRVTNYRAPQGKIEQQLVPLWEEMLEKEDIGIDDDFFVLGGNSISAIKLLSRIQRVYNVNVEMHKFFVAATISELAIEIENLMWQSFEVQEEEVEDKLTI